MNPVQDSNSLTMLRMLAFVTPVGAIIFGLDSYKYANASDTWTSVIYGVLAIADLTLSALLWRKIQISKPPK